MDLLTQNTILPKQTNLELKLKLRTKRCGNKFDNGFQLWNRKQEISLNLKPNQSLSTGDVISIAN
jgi:hypothetical protein